MLMQSNANDSAMTSLDISITIIFSSGKGGNKTTKKLLAKRGNKATKKLLEKGGNKKTQKFCQNRFLELPRPLAGS